MKLLLLTLLVSISATTYAQKYKSESGTVSFFSDATIEDIAATNKQCNSLFDSSTGSVAYIITVSGFEFDKSLMQEHFNEKYMESDKFPKASFKGKITGFNKSLSEEQSVSATGIMNIHGQSNEITVPGTIQFDNGVVMMKASFMIELADYKIKIPKLLWQNIAERVKVNVEFKYKAL